ncbi:7335_t:CDS:2, partial [Gigaspora rosea]
MVTANFKDVFSLLGIIFILSLNVHSKVHSFKPEPRVGHMETLVNDRIYFFGGGVQQDMKTFGNNATNSSLWSYNINSQRWDIVVLPNPSPGEVANLISMNE